jgi:hypothetical protein
MGHPSAGFVGCSDGRFPWLTVPRGWKLALRRPYSRFSSVRLPPPVFVPRIIWIAGARLLLIWARLRSTLALAGLGLSRPWPLSGSLFNGRCLQLEFCVGVRFFITWLCLGFAVTLSTFLRRVAGLVLWAGVCSGAHSRAFLPSVVSCVVLRASVVLVSARTLRCALAAVSRPSSAVACLI